MEETIGGGEVVGGDRGEVAGGNLAYLWAAFELGDNGDEVVVVVEGPDMRGGTGECEVVEPRGDDTISGVWQYDPERWCCGEDTIGGV